MAAARGTPAQHKTGGLSGEEGQLNLVWKVPTGPVWTVLDTLQCTPYSGCITLSHHTGLYTMPAWEYTTRLLMATWVVPPRPLLVFGVKNSF